MLLSFLLLTALFSAVNLLTLVRESCCFSSTTLCRKWFRISMQIHITSLCCKVKSLTPQVPPVTGTSVDGTIFFQLYSGCCQFKGWREKTVCYFDCVTVSTCDMWLMKLADQRKSIRIFTLFLKFHNVCYTNWRTVKLKVVYGKDHSYFRSLDTEKDCEGCRLLAKVQAERTNRVKDGSGETK